MRLYFILILFFANNCGLFAQTYTSYFRGDTANVQPPPKGGVCLMGGASENDNAMRWFLLQANQGDVVVIRATGADGYNIYLHSQLGLSPNSIKTLVIPPVLAANDPYIIRRINEAEGICYKNNLVVWVRGVTFVVFICFRL